MKTRRGVVFSLAGTVAVGWSSRLWAASDAARADDMPKATVIPGKPPVLDFGDGLKIPLDKSAFLTLWEGKSFWLTYGAGREPSSLAANGEAVHFASAAMQLLLLTLAFAPDRLEHVDGCGWRLKVQDPKYYVVGKIDLPGKPYFPITDAALGFGSADNPNLVTPPPGTSPEGGSAASWDPVMSITGEVDSFTTYILLKKDISLDYIRAHAAVL
jgi:hypothetical protein